MFKVKQKILPEIEPTPTAYVIKDIFVESIIKILAVKTCSNGAMDKIIDYLIERDKLSLIHAEESREKQLGDWKINLTSINKDRECQHP